MEAFRRIRRLSDLIDRIGDSWYVRNVLRRLDADEISLSKAVELLEWFHSEIVNSIEDGY